jgi:hypothetical protein
MFEASSKFTTAKTLLENNLLQNLWNLRFCKVFMQLFSEKIIYLKTDQYFAPWFSKTIPSSDKNMLPLFIFYQSA